MLVNSFTCMNARIYLPVLSGRASSPVPLMIVGGQVRHINDDEKNPSFEGHMSALLGVEGELGDLPLLDGKGEGLCMR